MQWLAQNIGTVVIAAAVIAIVAAIIVTMVRNKKHGKSSCGCGCSECALKDSCHTK